MKYVSYCACIVLSFSLNAFSASIEELVTLASKKPLLNFSSLDAAGNSEDKATGSSGKRAAKQAGGKAGKNTVPKPAGIDISSFNAFCETARGGDATAQAQLPEWLSDRARRTYAAMNNYGGLFFSVRKPVKGLDQAETNYAVSLNEFFKKTCDAIRVSTCDFSVQTKDGKSYQVSSLSFLSARETLAVKDGDLATEVPLAELVDSDRRFVESALADKVFESSLFKIAIKNGRSLKKSIEGQVIKVTDEGTGRTRDARISDVTSESTPRTLTLTNKGAFPLTHLFVEYQSFSEQTIQMFPDDFPEDYRSVGFVDIPRLMPGETREVVIDLPEIITVKNQTVSSGSMDMDIAFQPDVNDQSVGQTHGTWVKVHRFTAYGERLEREYKSPGTPASQWDYLAPVNVDIR